MQILHKKNTHTHIKSDGKLDFWLTLFLLYVCVCVCMCLRINLNIKWCIASARTEFDEENLMDFYLVNCVRERACVIITQVRALLWSNYFCMYMRYKNHLSRRLNIFSLKKITVQNNNNNKAKPNAQCTHHFLVIEKLTPHNIIIQFMCVFKKNIMQLKWTAFFIIIFFHIVLYVYYAYITTKREISIIYLIR